VSLLLQLYSDEPSCSLNVGQAAHLVAFRAGTHLGEIEEND
jgi:hypothetical protein